MNGFVIVHAGAGHHAPQHVKAYKDMCFVACIKAAKMLRSGASAVEAVTTAVMALEDNPLTNAGRGSNLTIDGKVECDACIMDGGQLRYAAVGALQGYKNPISVAHHLLTHSADRLSLNLIAPCILVGRGAQLWAEAHGLPSVSDIDMCTESSVRRRAQHTRRLEKSKAKKHPMSCNVSDEPEAPASKIPCRTSLSTLAKSNRNVPAQSQEYLFIANHSMELPTATDKIAADAQHLEVNNDTHGVTGNVESPARADDLLCANDGDVVKMSTLDTVGAVCVDSAGVMATAASSGGLSLKCPGRLGQACSYGAGVWSQNYKKSGIGVGCSTSGCGEQLIKTLIAKECASAVSHSQNPMKGLTDCLHNHFIHSDFLSHDGEKLAGVILVRTDVEKNLVDLLWSHSTSSFVIGYMSTDDTSPRTKVSRLPDTQIVGQSLVSEGVCLSLTKEIT